MTDQDRDIIFRVASQDLAGVLEIVTAVASGKSTPAVMQATEYVSPAEELRIRQMCRQHTAERISKKAGQRP